MSTEESILSAIGPMLHNRLTNYIVPGLLSDLVGGGDFGKVRLFSIDRLSRDWITPHDHRFDFVAWVLQGAAHNTIFCPAYSSGDEWVKSTIDQVCGANGIREYVHTREEKPQFWTQVTTTYTAGEIYSMKHTSIHSIIFDRHTRVLMFESPQHKTRSTMLEPWVAGKVVPTFKVEPWMFEKGAP